MSDNVYQWYYGPGEEPEYCHCVFGTREETVTQAWSEYPEGGFCVIEADKQVPSFDCIPADWVIERYEECNEECWGEDGAEISPTREQEKELEASLGAVLEAWMNKYDLAGRVWSFGHTRNKEYFGPVEGNVALKSADPASSVSSADCGGGK